MTILKEMKTPIFYIEGTPSNIEREKWILEVEWSGKRLQIPFVEIEALPMTTVNARMTSVSGFTVRAEWQGVKWTDFVQAFNIPTYSHVDFASFSFYTSCLPWKDLDYHKVLLCYKVGGEYLEAEYGAPLRMFIPHLWGYKGVKGLAKIILCDKYRPGFWEQRGYSDSGEIEPGTTLDVNSGSYKRIPGGEVTEF